jgi:hypothetical protein
MSLGMTYHQTLPHLCAHQIVGLMTGHHMAIGLSSKLQTFYTVTIRCLVVTLILYSTFGLLLWQVMVTLHLLPTTPTCMRPSMQPPLGDLFWESFSLQYNGVQPEGDVPSWMMTEYDV